MHYVLRTKPGFVLTKQNSTSSPNKRIMFVW